MNMLEHVVSEICECRQTNRHIDMVMTILHTSCGVKQLVAAEPYGVFD